MQIGRESASGATNGRPSTSPARRRRFLHRLPGGQVADADILRKQPDRGELPFRILPVVDALLQQLDHLAVFQHGDSVILFKNIPNLVYLYYTKVFFICQYPEKIFIGFHQSLRRA